MMTDFFFLLWPNITEIANFGAILCVAVVCIGLGALGLEALSLIGRFPQRADSDNPGKRIELQLIAGWGFACILLTLWGTLSRQSLALPGAALFILAAVGMLWPRARPSPAERAAMLKSFALSLPLVLLMLSARPALPDTFLNLLPNAAFLVDHDLLPDHDGVATLSIFPALPYHQQFIVYLASLLTGQLVSSGLVHFNLLLLLVMGLGFARLLIKTSSQPPLKPSLNWGRLAFGLLLATILNPGFMPKTAFSSMGEGPSSITLALAAILGLEALEKHIKNRPVTPTLLVLALVLTAHINIRQSNIGLFLGLMAGLALLTLSVPKGRRMTAFIGFVLASLPAALLWAWWRFYVTTHFTAGELKLIPLEQWPWRAIPVILADMLERILRRPYLYIALLATLALLPRAAMRYGWSETHDSSNSTRSLILLLAVCLTYTLFLLFTYIAHFSGVYGVGAHSFYRYTTHYSLLCVLALVFCARESFAHKLTAKRLALAKGLSILTFLLLPLVGVTHLRFDLAPLTRIAWDMSKAIAPALGNNRHLAILAPGNNDGFALTLKGYLVLTEPRRSQLVFTNLDNATAETRNHIASAGVSHMLIACAQPLPTENAALLFALDANGYWQREILWPYPAWWNNSLPTARDKSFICPIPVPNPDS